jgi:hypothetical protein
MLFQRFGSRIVVAVAALVLCQTGCKKSDEEGAAPVAEEAAQAAPPLEGGADVLAALQRKDYQAAVSALASAKARATPEQMMEYRELRGQVQEVLVQEMGRSPAAAEAYKVLRIVETGR